MKLKYLLFLIFILSISISAQSPDKILSRANKALGGEKVLKSIVSWQAKGKITRLGDGSGGNYQAQAARPNLYGENFDLNGFEYAAGYNGKSGWARDSKNGLRTLTGDSARDFQTEANFRANRWLDVKADKIKITSGGKSNINGTEVNVVVLKNTKGGQIKLYFDAVNNLLLREEIPQNSGIKITDYGDYRNVNGIRQAFSIVSKSGDEIYEIKLDEVNFNRQIAKSDFDFPRISNEPLPDIKTLLSEIRANADRIDGILDNYSYLETRIEREVDKAGNLVEKDSETTSLSFYKGYRIRRAVAKNGKPLSVSAQADEDKKIEKQVKEIEERIAEREKKQQKLERELAAGKTGTPENENKQRISLSDALRGSLLVNPRRERFRGRDVIVFDYEPNPAFKPQTRIEKLLALCTGAVWVDAEDKQIVRLEALLTKNTGNFIGKVKRGTSFSLENERINNEIWLPSVADISISVKILFAGININNLIKYGDYKRFNTEVKEGKVN